MSFKLVEAKADDNSFISCKDFFNPIRNKKGISSPIKFDMCEFILCLLIGLKNDKKEDLKNFELQKTAFTQKYIEDYIIFYSILKKGFCAFGLKEDLMRYRVVKGSFSRHKYNYAIKVWKTYRKIENLNILSTVYYFCHYAIRGLVKYSKF